jgi:hypothetical protein
MIKIWVQQLAQLRIERGLQEIRSPHAFAFACARGIANKGRTGMENDIDRKLTQREDGGRVDMLI